jgi:hypothetical protein
MKTKRRMPAHIVLPNGMWRFVKRGKKKTSVRRSKRKSVKVYKTRGVSMVRRGKRRGHSSGGLGNWLMPLAIGALSGAVVYPMVSSKVPQLGAFGATIGGAGTAAGVAYLTGKKSQVLKYAIGGAFLAPLVGGLIGGNTGTDNF